MTLTVQELRAFLEECGDDDLVVVRATLADGSVLGADDLRVGTDQGGPDGEGIEVVLEWEPGAEVITRAE
jgi:hypothetical protein